MHQLVPRAEVSPHTNNPAYDCFAEIVLPIVWLSERQLMEWYCPLNAFKASIISDSNMWHPPSVRQSSWEYSNVDPEYGELWSGFAEAQGAQAVEALKCYRGWNQVETLVDVGGYKGAILSAIVAAHRHIRGINFDLPHVVAEAPNAPGKLSLINAHVATYSEK